MKHINKVKVSAEIVSSQIDSEVHYKKNNKLIVYNGMKSDLLWSQKLQIMSQRVKRLEMLGNSDNRIKCLVNFHNLSDLDEDRVDL